MSNWAITSIIGLTSLLAWANLAASDEPAARPGTQERPDGARVSRQKPQVALTISKQTTYITEPLRKDGYVDYIAALNRMFSAGVTPENNADPPLLKAFGPGEIDPKYRDEYYRLLGIPSAAEKGGSFVKLDDFARQWADAQKRRNPSGKPVHYAYWDQFDEAMKRPWSKEEFPILAGWVTANAKSLELTDAASKRPRHFNPLVSASLADSAAIATLLGTVVRYREGSRLLVVRAMLCLQEGDTAGAWQKLLACHRLARLLGQGPTLVEALVAIAIDGIACRADQALLRGRLTAAQASAMRADLDRLPPLPKMFDVMNVGERLFHLDFVATVAREGFHALDSLAFGEQSKREIQSLIGATAGKSVDWDQALRVGNTWYDRVADACGKPDWSERLRAAREVDDDLKRLAAASKDWKSPGPSLRGDPRGPLSEWVGGALVCFDGPIGCLALVNAEGRAATQFELIRLAFALAAYRADQGAYPPKLADLAPKYVAKVPRDIFNDSELHYRREGDGYLLYSVGPNGKDDGGKGYDDCKAAESWDDVAVRVPGPAAPKR
jgi:hypothetical protein